MCKTQEQVVAGFGAGRESRPVLAQRRGEISAVFNGGDQHDVFEFLEQLFQSARATEIAAGRYGLWGHVQGSDGAATHVERLFGFVRETRRRCTVCRGSVRAWFSSEKVLRVTPTVAAGGCNTLSDLCVCSSAARWQKRCVVAIVRETQRI